MWTVRALLYPAPRLRQSDRDALDDLGVGHVPVGVSRVTSPPALASASSVTAAACSSSDHKARGVDLMSVEPRLPETRQTGEQCCSDPVKSTTRYHQVRGTRSTGHDPKTTVTAVVREPGAFR